jgi:hypothetical protein
MMSFHKGMVYFVALVVLLIGFWSWGSSASDKSPRLLFRAFYQPGSDAEEEDAVFLFVQNVTKESLYIDAEKLANLKGGDFSWQLSYRYRLAGGVSGSQARRKTSTDKPERFVRLEPGDIFGRSFHPRDFVTLKLLKESMKVDFKTCMQSGGRLTFRKELTLSDSEGRIAGVAESSFFVRLVADLPPIPEPKDSSKKESAK